MLRASPFASFLAGTLLLIASLFVPTVSTHPLSLAHLWPDVCQPVRFQEFLSLARSSGSPVSLGPYGYYLHFGNARCFFFRAASSGDADRFLYYHQALVDAL
ncbi:hypothetical protein RB595_002783 [Gaeumannomyces hyphopodioides]